MEREPVSCKMEHPKNSNLPEETTVELKEKFLLVIRNGGVCQRPEFIDEDFDYLQRR